MTCSTRLVLRLLEKETLSRKEVLEVFATVQKRPTRGTYTGLRQAAALGPAAGPVAEGTGARGDLRPR